MYSYNPYRSRFHAPEPDIEMFKVNMWVQVIGTPRVYKITRVDCHAYPICAGYYRWKPKQLIIVAEPTSK